MSIEVKHVKPGDPEFLELAAKITDIRKIRKGLSNDKERLYSEVSPDYHKGRRNENKIR